MTRTMMAKNTHFFLKKLIDIDDYKNIILKQYFRKLVFMYSNNAIKQNLIYLL
jgi:hypothetical protein